MLIFHEVCENWSKRERERERESERGPSANECLSRRQCIPVLFRAPRRRCCRTLSRNMYRILSVAPSWSLKPVVFSVGRDSQVATRNSCRKGRPFTRQEMATFPLPSPHQQLFPISNLDNNFIRLWLSHGLLAHRRARVTCAKWEKQYTLSNMRVFVRRNPTAQPVVPASPST